MHLLFILLVFSSVFEIVIDICVAPFCNSPHFHGKKVFSAIGNDDLISA